EEQPAKRLYFELSNAESILKMLSADEDRKEYKHPVKEYSAQPGLLSVVLPESKTWREDYWIYTTTPDDWEPSWIAGLTIPWIMTLAIFLFCVEWLTRKLLRLA